MNHCEIYLAPLQGHTDKAWRSTLNKHFPSVDRFYTPYLTIEHLLKYQGIPKEWLHDESELVCMLQILPGNLDELKSLTLAAQAIGQKTINLNMGCPYPMVTNRGRGAALLAKPDLISDFLSFIKDNTNLAVSIKTRLGISQPDEILKIIEIVAPFNPVEIILHARTAKQMYKGQVDIDAYKQCCQNFPGLKLVYNGDILSVKQHVEISEKLELQQYWMIGRGILQNPFLPWQIKHSSQLLPDSYRKKLHAFTTDWIAEVEASSNDVGHALNRIVNQFAYFHKAFPDAQKARRLVRKTKSLADLKRDINWLFVD